jgi:hypothetical protein
MRTLCSQRKFYQEATHSKINKGVPKNSFFYVLYAHKFYTLWSFYVYNVSYTRIMITSETPYKLAEIIRDTWPGLYRKPEPSYNEEKEIEDEQVS